MKVLHIKSGKSGTSSDVCVRLRDRKNKDLDRNMLGLVQSLTWKAKVGELARCEMETIMTEAELEIALKDIDIGVKLRAANLPCSKCNKINARLFKKIWKRVK